MIEYLSNLIIWFVCSSVVTMVYSILGKENLKEFFQRFKFVAPLTLAITTVLYFISKAIV